MIGVGTTIFLVNPVTFPVSTSYLVDTYSPIIAFSVRKLSSTATNCLRVRRDSDNAEQDIGFSGNDLDTASLSTFVGANSGFVVKMYNQGTGGATYDATQSTAATQPRIVNAGTIETTTNGKACLNSVSSDWLQMANQYNQSGSAQTYTHAFERPSSGINSVLGGGGGSGSAANTWFTNNVKYVFYTSQSNDAASTATGEFIGFTSRTSGNSVNLWTNDVAASNNPTTESQSMSILYIMRQSANIHSGKWMEAIIFDSDETANRTAIQDDINGYYSIY